MGEKGAAAGGGEHGGPRDPETQILLLFISKHLCDLAQPITLRAQPSFLQDRVLSGEGRAALQGRSS